MILSGPLPLAIDVAIAANSLPSVTGSASIRCVLPIFLNPENCTAFSESDLTSPSTAGTASARFIRIETCIAVGYVSLLDCDMFT